MAKKDITVVTSLVGAGLEREYLILRDLLMTNDCYVEGIHYTDLNCALHPSDITISMEVILPRALTLSRENWFIPNSEWYDSLNDRFLSRMTKIICKTTDCYAIWSQKVGPEKCVYTSFEARDLYRPEIPRELKCLHIAGKSEYKNTEAVLGAWRMMRPGNLDPLPHLTAIVRAPCFDNQFTLQASFPDKNVTHLTKVTDEEVIQLMNSHQIHVIPSMYEGFGHVIHEGLGCDATVITTDAAPMNTYEGIARDCLVPARHRNPRSLAHLNWVDYTTVNEAVRKAIKLGPQTGARQAFLSNRVFFRTKFMELVDAV